MTVPDELIEPMENLLDKFKAHGFKFTGYDQEGGEELELVFPNPQSTRECDSDDYEELRDALATQYSVGDEDESLNYDVEVQRIKRKGKIAPELKVKLDVSRSWVNYDREDMSEEFDIDEYEPEGNFQKKCPAYKDMTRANKIKMLGLEDCHTHEVGTFSGSGDSGDYEPSGGTLGNTDFQSWICGKVESLMESAQPNFNNEGSYGSVNMSVTDGVITLNLECNVGFQDTEQMADLEEII